MAMDLFDEDATEYFNERAGIREFDGGQSRESAEAAAMVETVEHMFRCEVRSIIRKRVEGSLEKAKSFLQQIEAKRGAEATSRLRNEVNVQWSKGNRGNPGEWL